MDLLTVLGFAAGIVVMLMGVTENGSLSAFYDVGSIYVTIGGTLCALLMNFPLKSLINVFPALFKAFFSRTRDPVNIIDNICELADQARKNGMLSLEEKVLDYNDDFLTRGVNAIIDSHDPQKVRDILETEVSFIKERHRSTHTILEKGAAYAPAFGMIGTLIGLINMLGQMDDPDTLGPNMSIALVTTFYGAVLANLVFLPLAGKLKALDEEEMFSKQLVIEGMLSIQMGENPRLIRERLMGFLPQSTKKRQSRKRRAVSKPRREAL